MNHWPPIGMGCNVRWYVLKFGQAPRLESPPFIFRLRPPEAWWHPNHGRVLPGSRFKGNPFDIATLTFQDEIFADTQDNVHRLGPVGRARILTTSDKACLKYGGGQSCTALAMKSYCTLCRSLIIATLASSTLRPRHWDQLCQKVPPRVHRVQARLSFLLW